MNTKSKNIIALFAIVLLVSETYGHKYTGKEEEGSGKKGNDTPVVMAGCSPATAKKDLDINNTRALIHSGGDMWWDLIGAARYEIPKNSGRMSLFAGALWMGGKDVSGQLKVAGQRFRDEGNDYWTGPLSTVTSEISTQTCVDWDKHFVTTRDEVSQFAAWYQAGLDDAASGTTTQQDNFENYQIPKSILDWPAHGRNYEPYNEDFYLAPFYDRNSDGVYNPLDGDFPGYDFSSQPSCTQGKIDKIYGDQNLWWIFNDKGNAHTQTGSASIGMEIRAQAFAFATSDEVNNMTFYNYELYNRSSYTLTETFFGQWVDCDLGDYQDDFVGCDVQRGLGYAYNGDEFDGDNGGALGYGSQPPAIGVDFFQGPYQDNDEMDNPGPLSNTSYLPYNIAFNNGGIPYKGIGIGYGDGVVDNERFGMRKFLYHNNNSSVTGDPSTGAQYYNYLKGFWKDGTRMVYGGNGHQASGGTMPADYMFPDDSDPVGWGTEGVSQPVWNEVTAGNQPADRRFMQSAGPFTLGPGAVNNITVGIVWAQAVTGGRWASLQQVRKADDKTQAMFDNCFRVLNGPDAPELSFRELDRELILYITNKSVSNNYNESYLETDIFLGVPDSVDKNGDGVKDYALTAQERADFSTFKFQGYLIYQVKDNSVSPNDLKNPEKARLVAQCDVKDGITRIINNYNAQESPSGVESKQIEVEGADKGIIHSIRINEDKFFTGDDKRLINHKKVYFMAIAYAYNYSPYNEYLPFIEQQQKPFLASRKAAVGGIRPFAAIPHKTEVENNGSTINAQYGDEMSLTRIEGAGNGGRVLLMTSESHEEAIANGRVKNIEYMKGYAPVSIKVVDPLNIPKADFHIAFFDSVTHPKLTDKDTRIDSSGYWWYLWEDGKYVNGKLSSTAILIENEELLLDWGISVTTKQVSYPRSMAQSSEYGNDLLGAALTFGDRSKPWLTGVPDADGASAQNWIRAGSASAGGNPLVANDSIDDRYYSAAGEREYIDEDQVYEKILGGTWAPFLMCAQLPHGPVPKSGTFNNGSGANPVTGNFQLKYLYSVDIVFTSDKSKWSRCPVVETQDVPTLSSGIILDSIAYYPPNIPALTPANSNYVKGLMRSAPSVDKNGKPFDTTGFAAKGWLDAQKNVILDSVPSSSNPEDPNFISAFGMGWFPGYAINIETGERLNIAFGEDSWLGAENGRDMLWNPTSNIFEGPFDDVRMGGKHYIYVFRNNVVEDTAAVPNPADRMPSYDHGKWMFQQLKKVQKSGAIAGNEFKRVYRAAMWVGLPLLERGFELLPVSDGLIPTDAIVTIRVSRPFENYGTGSFVSYGTPLTTGKYYFVDKGPVIHNSKTYVRGQSFIAKNDSFSVVDAINGDIIDNLVTRTDEQTSNLGRPVYTFSTREYATDTAQGDVMKEALKLINVVPNPYYAYSEYETDKVDNRIKIINLPQKCNVSIYTTNGTLVRKFSKDDPTITSIDWDLKNNVRIPIASGVYIIHVEVPGVGERTLKWMGIMRPVDLDSF